MNLEAKSSHGLLDMDTPVLDDQLRHWIPYLTTSRTSHHQYMIFEYYRVSFGTNNFNLGIKKKTSWYILFPRSARFVLAIFWEQEKKSYVPSNMAASRIFMLDFVLFPQTGTWKTVLHFSWEFDSKILWTTVVIRLSLRSKNSMLYN